MLNRIFGVMMMMPTFVAVAFHTNIHIQFSMCHSFICSFAVLFRLNVFVCVFVFCIVVVFGFLCHGYVVQFLCFFLSFRSFAGLLLFVRLSSSFQAFHCYLLCVENESWEFICAIVYVVHIVWAFHCKFYMTSIFFRVHVRTRKKKPSAHCSSNSNSHSEKYFGFLVVRIVFVLIVKIAMRMGIYFTSIVECCWCSATCILYVCVLAFFFNEYKWTNEKYSKTYCIYACYKCKSNVLLKSITSNGMGKRTNEKAREKKGTKQQSQ